MYPNTRNHLTPASDVIISPLITFNSSTWRCSVSCEDWRRRCWMRSRRRLLSFEHRRLKSSSSKSWKVSSPVWLDRHFLVNIKFHDHKKPLWYCERAARVEGEEGAWVLLLRVDWLAHDWEEDCSGIITNIPPDTCTYVGGTLLLALGTDWPGEYWSRMKPYLIRKNRKYRF